MTHPLRACGLFVLVVVAACQSAFPPTLAPTNQPGASSVAPTPSTAPTTTVTALPTETPLPTPTAIATITETTKLATVTLEVPAPLIPAGTTITIEAHPPEDAPRDMTDAGVHQSFHVLAPQALTFAEPIRVTAVMDRARFERADGSVAIVYLAIRDGIGAWHWLADASETITATTVELSGTTTTLGMLFAWSDLTNLVAPAADQGNRLVGQSFTPEFLLRASTLRPHPVTLGDAVFFNVDDPTVVEHVAGTAGPTRTTFRCVAMGWYNLAFTDWLSNFAADNQFLINSLHLPPLSGALTYVMTGSCSTGVNVTPPPPNSSPSSSP